MYLKQHVVLDSVPWFDTSYMGKIQLWTWPEVPIAAIPSSVASEKYFRVYLLLSVRFYFYISTLSSIWYWLFPYLFYFIFSFFLACIPPGFPGMPHYCRAGRVSFQQARKRWLRLWALWLPIRLDGYERIKGAVVEWNNESGADRKDIIEYWEVPSWEVLGSLHVNVTPWYEGYHEGCLPNTDQIRWLSDDQILLFDKLVWYIYD